MATAGSRPRCCWLRSWRLVVAMARPQALVAASRSDTSIILTLDVSRSMCSTDVSPNRLAAAQEAAREFVDDQPERHAPRASSRSPATAQILVPPTTDRDRLHDAIDGLTTSIGTAIGNGVAQRRSTHWRG